MSSLLTSSAEGRRSPSPSKDGFLFKSSTTEDWDRIVKTSSPRPRSAAGFEKFPDYSKINAERHNAKRNNTFRTPSSINDKTSNTPVRIGKRDLYELCEQSFRRSVSNLSKDIVQDVKQELQQSLEVMRREGSEAVEAQQHRESTFSVMLKQIYEMLHDRNIDKELLQKELRSGETLVLEGQRDLMLRLESKFMQSFDQVRNELQDVRRAQEEAEDELRTKLRGIIKQPEIISTNEHLLQRTAEQVTQVASLQKSLNAYCLQNSKEIQNLHENQTQHRDTLFSEFQAQLGRKFQDTIIRVDNTQVLNQIKKYHISSSTDYNQLLREVGKIQKALNLDFCHVFEEIEEISHQRKLPLSSSSADLELDTPKNGPRKRMREYWAQTDAAEMADAWCQTDGKSRLTTRDARGKLSTPRKTRKTQMVIPKSALEKVAEKAKTAQPLFADAEAMRIKAQQALVKPQYNVLDHYHEYGCAQRIAKSSTFEQCTLLAIILNAIWIAIDVDLNKAELLIDASPVFQVAEHTFCTYFTLELLIRFLAFRRKSSCLRDFWFVFDLGLVLMMIGETWILTLVVSLMDTKEGTPFGGASILRILRIVKMVRVSRMARLFKAMPELVILLKGIGVAARSVSVFFVLWVIIIYVFAILFRQLTEGDAIGDEYFRTVPDAMNTLLLDGILPETSDLVNELAHAKPFLWPIILFFVLFASVTLMYMLMGVLVDVVSAIACTEKEGMTVMLLASSLRAALEDMGRDTEASISKIEFQELMVDKEIARICQSVDVDVVMCVDMVDVIFEAFDKEGKDMKFAEFIDTLLKMRGHNTATVKDIKAQLKVIKQLVADNMNTLLKQIAGEFTQLRTELKEQAEMQHSLHVRMRSDLSLPTDSSEDEGSVDEDEISGGLSGLLQIPSSLSDSDAEERKGKKLGRGKSYSMGEFVTVSDSRQ